MTVLNLSTRIRFVNEDGTLTSEAYRSLAEIISRTGGTMGSVGGDTFVTNNDLSSVQGQSSAGGDLGGDVAGAMEVPSVSDMTPQPVEAPMLLETTPQPASVSALDEMVLQPASELRFVDLPQATTAQAPAYKKGRLYFDTTLNKARIGGATAYETITST
jgi:hypothetical protein